MSKIFTDLKAKTRFVELYSMATDVQKDEFGKAIRKKFDEKVTSLEDLSDFYINQYDVDEIWKKIEYSESVNPDGS